MEKKEEIIQIITDRVMNHLENEDPKPVASFIGEPSEYVKAYYRDRGYKISNELSVEPINVLVITELSLYELTRLANITPFGELETKFLKRIMNNEPIVIIEETMEYTEKKNSIPKIMQLKFEKAINDLKKWGVRFLTRSDFSAESNRKSVPLEATVTKKKELISVNKVQNSGLASGDVFTVKSNMIITPLAKDYLREHHIQLIERDT